MTWAKVDDHANEHRKQIAAGAEACWLWTCGLMYANRQAARDGFIPAAIVGMLYPLKNATKLAKRLVEVGLWVAVDGGYQVHQFTAWNQTKEQRDHELEQGRLRAARSHALRAKTSASSGEDTERRLTEAAPKLQESSGSLSTPSPLPTTPEQSESKQASPQDSWDGSERETLCPLDLWARAKALKIPEQLADSLHIDVEAVHENIREFTSYWTIGGGMGQKRRHWMRRLRENVRKAAGKPGGLAAPGALEHQRLTGRRAQEVNPNLDHETRKALAASKRYAEFVAGAK